VSPPPHLRPCKAVLRTQFLPFLPEFAIASAKAYHYAYEAEQAASEWADFLSVSFSTSEAAGCGKFPSIDDLLKSFLHLVNAPDKVVQGIDYASIPCPKGKCKPRNGNDSDKDGDKDKDKDKPSDAPKTGNPGSATRTSKTDDASSTIDSHASTTKGDDATKTTADTTTPTRTATSDSGSVTRTTTGVSISRETATRTSSDEHPFSDFLDKLCSLDSKLPTRTKGSTNTAKPRKCGGHCRFRDEL
jgi:hypothetical protein